MEVRKDYLKGLVLASLFESLVHHNLEGITEQRFHILPESIQSVCNHVTLSMAVTDVRRSTISGLFSTLTGRIRHERFRENLLLMTYFFFPENFIAPI